MIKTKTILEVKIGERVYSLEIFPESPLGEVHDALCMMKGHIVKLIADEQWKEDKKTQEAQVDECVQCQ